MKKIFVIVVIAMVLAPPSVSDDIGAVFVTFYIMDSITKIVRRFKKK